MKYWIITVKEPYCGYILRGVKTIELRKAIPSSLSIGDVIFIVRKGEKGHIVGACKVTSVKKESVWYYSHYCIDEHKIYVQDVLDYAGQRRFLFGIGLKKLKLYAWCLYVRSFGYDSPPQNFYRIKPEYMSTIDRVLIKI